MAETTLVNAELQIVQYVKYGNDKKKKSFLRETLSKSLTVKVKKLILRQFLGLW